MSEKSYRKIEIGSPSFESRGEECRRVSDIPISLILDEITF
jgi:hypothetical protein